MVHDEKIPPEESQKYSYSTAAAEESFLVVMARNHTETIQGSGTYLSTCSSSVGQLVTKQVA